MLRTGLTHPQILESLAAAGHGSLVLISDGNFPSLTAPHAGARRVYLNLAPGVVTVTDVLATLRPVMPIEKAVLMDADDGAVPEAHAAIVGLLAADTPVEHVSRSDFYLATRSDRLALVIASGDERWYANVLLTMGAVTDSGRGLDSPTSSAAAGAADRQ